MTRLRRNVLAGVLMLAVYHAGDYFDGSLLAAVGVVALAAGVAGLIEVAR